MNESHFLSLLLIHQIIDGLALVAEFALRIGYLCIDIYQIANLFSQILFAKLVIITELSLNLHQELALFIK